MSSRSLRALTAQQVTQFRLDGFLVVEDVLSAAEVERIAAHCDRIAAGTVTHIPATSIQQEKIFREGAAPVVDPVLAVRKLFNATRGGAI
ncbi:MAG: phytanoyl-CoA dioxygenase family protein [Chloroflexi bacterium]|nr:phytanoyl-CoA dioxygenase family protein [Chloroflexota bacterium]